MTKDSKETQKDEPDFPASRAGDFMINSLLRDHLKRNLPPDFEQRILVKLNAKRLGTVEPPPISVGAAIYNDDELDEALGAAQADVEFVSDGQFRTVVTTLEQSDSKMVPKVLRVHPRLWHYNWARRSAAIAALAASLLVMYSAYQWIDLSGSPSKGTISAVPRPQPESNLPTMEETTAQWKPPLADEALLSPSPSPVDSAMPAAELVALSENPVDRYSKFGIEWLKTLPQPTGVEPKELTSVIDSQLKLVWDKAGVPVKLSATDEAWIDRVTFLAVGRVPTSVEREVFRSEKSGDRQKQYIDKLVQSEEFAIHWGRLLGEHYLGQPISNLKSQTSSLQEFVGWLKQSIARDVPIASLESQLVSSEGRSSALPADFWLSETISREAASISDLEKSSALKRRFLLNDAPFVGAAGQLLHKSGHAAAVCTQCHTQDSSAIRSLPLVADLSDSDFWGIPAAVAREAGRRKLSGAKSASHEKYEFYFEQSDGRVALAIPGISPTPQSSNQKLLLQDWLLQDSNARNGVVELVWTQIFGQPLVPVFGLDESEYATDRQDLKRLLAIQLQADGSLREFVASLLNTSSLKVPTANVTPSWFLAASDDLLSKYHQRARLFSFTTRNVAIGGVARSPSPTDLASWFEKSDTSKTSTLAQPSVAPLSRSASSPANTPIAMDEVQLRFLLSTSKPYKRLSSFVDTVSANEMEWNDKVNHAYLLFEGRYPTRSERSDADKVLQLVGGDANRALLLLSTGRFGSY